MRDLPICIQEIKNEKQKLLLQSLGLELHLALCGPMSEQWQQCERSQAEHPRLQRTEPGETLGLDAP